MIGIYPPLQQGICFLKASQPRPPTACLAVSLPQRGEGAGVAAFRVSDPMSDLGVFLNTGGSTVPCKHVSGLAS